MSKNFNDHRLTSHGLPIDDNRWSRLFVFYLSLGLVRVFELLESIVGVQWGAEKSQPEGPPFQWETRLAEFPPEGWTRGLGFLWNH